MLGNLAFRNAPAFQVCPVPVFHFLIRGRKDAVVLAHALIPDLMGMPFNKHPLFPHGLHGVRIQLHAPDGCHARAAPVKVDTSVIVHKQVGIPERERTFHFLIGAVQNIPGSPAVAVLRIVGRTQPDPPVPDAHVRGIVIQRKLLRQPMAFPVHQIIRYPDAQRHGRKNIVASFKADHGRVRRLAADLDPPLQSRVRVELIPVRNRQRITQIFHRSSLPSPPHAPVRQAAGFPPAPGP